MPSIARTEPHQEMTGEAGFVTVNIFDFQASVIYTQLEKFLSGVCLTVRRVWDTVTAC